MRTGNFRPLVLILTALFCMVSVNQGGAKTINDKIKDLIDDASAALKKGIDALGDNLVAIQKCLEKYPWKGIIQDEASSGPAKLKHLQLNGHKKVVVARPGERIEGIVQCTLDRERCTALNFQRVAIGIKGIGAQTTICNYLGIAAGESLETFSLIAPVEQGFYEIRFRHAEALFESVALDAWKDQNGNEPDGRTTIGIIYVKP